MFANREICLSRRSAGQPRGRLRSLERLESRILLATAEGTPFAFNQQVEASGLSGSLSASIAWGDGTSSPGAVSTGEQTPLVGRIDYTYDTQMFFDTQLKRDLFQQAVDTVLSRLGDDLTAITPSGRNSWTADFSHPGSGSSQTISNLSIPANEIVIYAGGRELGTTLAIGGPGGFNVSCANASFCDTVSTRGQAGASQGNPTDFGPWGGSIAFDVSTNFHYSQSTDDLGPRETDFLSVAIHEVAHLLGFGTAGSWATFVSSGVFNGPAARAANGNQSVTLFSDGSHWAQSTMSDGQEAGLDPTLTVGTRKFLTTLDYAGLDDIGWELIQPDTTVTGSHTYGDDGLYDIVVTVVGSSGGLTTGSSQELVTNVAPTLVATNDQIVGFGQTFSIFDIATFADPGFGNSETFSYSIDWGDQSELDTGTASIDSLGAAGITTKGSFDGMHTYSNGGVYNVSVTVADDDGGASSDTLQLTVGLALSLEIAAGQISEHAGSNATTLTITRHSNDLSQALLVTLSADDSEIEIPDSVELAVGQATVVVAVHAVDDHVLDGTQGVTVTASAPGHDDASDVLLVTDHETLSVSLSVDTIAENDGTNAAIVTITRGNTDLDTSLMVVLKNSHPLLATLPTSVVIPYGQSSISVALDAVDNAVLGANDEVTIVATASGYVAGAATLEVTDHETISLSIDATTVLESAGMGAAIATITRNNTNIDDPLTVTIAIDDPSEASAQPIAVIQAGEATATFEIHAISDGLDDGPQLVTVSAVSIGYVPTIAHLRIADAASWHNIGQPGDVDGDTHVSPIDALRIINDLNSRGARPLSPPELADVPPYLDVNNDGFVSPVDALIVINALNSASLNSESESTSGQHLDHRGASLATTQQNLHHSDTMLSAPLRAHPLKRKIVFFADQLGDTLTDDLVADIVTAFNRRP